MSKYTETLWNCYYHTFYVNFMIQDKYIKEYYLLMKFFTPDIKFHIISIKAKSKFKIKFSK